MAQIVSIGKSLFTLLALMYNLSLQFLHQGTICLHEMFADVTNPADVSTQRLLASARGILRMVYLLNATSLDVSTVMPAGFGFYTAARTLLLFLDHALESGSNTGGGSEVLRSEIEVFRMVFEVNLVLRIIRLVGLGQNRLSSNYVAGLWEAIPDRCSTCQHSCCHVTSMVSSASIARTLILY